MVLQQPAHQAHDTFRGGNEKTKRKYKYKAVKLDWSNTKNPKGRHALKHEEKRNLANPPRTSPQSSLKTTIKRARSMNGKFCWRVVDAIVLSLNLMEQDQVLKQPAFAWLLLCDSHPA